MEKIFYKYKSCEDSKFNFVIDSLEKKYFFISRPSQLNDEDEVNIIYNYNVPDQDLNFWLSNHPRTAKNYYNFITYLKNKGIYCFNTELDYLRYKKGKENFQKGMNRINDLDREHFHIFSLTDDKNNTKMWKEYSNEYNGICLGFMATNNITLPVQGINIINDLFIEVLSDSDDNVIEDKITGKKYCIICPIKYSRRERSIIINPFIMKKKEERDKMKESFLVKNNYNDIKNDRKDWSYEKESRLLYIDNHFPREELIDIKLHYPEYILQEVIFGHNLESSKKEQILNCLKKYSNFKAIKLSTI